MTLEERKERAVYLKHNGYNCAEAILITYSDLIDLDKDTLVKIGSGFGSGMGGFEATCGALVGANIVLGILNTTDIKTKFISKEMVSEFKNMSGALLCKDLKGIETKHVLCSCEDCIRNAIEILDKKSNEMKN